MSEVRRFFVVLAPCGCWYISCHYEKAYASEIAKDTRKAIEKGHEHKVVTAEEWKAIPHGCRVCTPAAFSPDSFDALALELQ